MNNLTDKQLWQIVRQPIDRDTDTWLSQLTALGKERELTPDEQTALEQRMNEYNQWVQRRSEAMLILKQRGHKVLEILAKEDDMPERYTTLRRFRLWKLDIRVKEYGVDYYWNGAWILTSAPRYIIIVGRAHTYNFAWFNRRLHYQMDDRK